MALLNWKQNIGIGNLSSEKAKTLLKNFRYPTEIDKKGRLNIDAGLSKFVIVLKDNGPDSTIIGVSHFKMKFWVAILLIIFLCAFLVPGLIFAGIINSKRKSVYLEAVRLMNQNIRTDSADTVSEDPSHKIENLKNMLEKGLITEKDFEMKKSDILAAY